MRSATRGTFALPVTSEDCSRTAPESMLKVYLQAMGFDLVHLPWVLITVVVALEGTRCTSRLDLCLWHQLLPDFTVVALLAPLLCEAVVSFTLRLVALVTGSFPHQNDHLKQDLNFRQVMVAPCPHSPPLLNELVVLSGQLPACLQVTKHQHHAYTHQPGHLTQRVHPVMASLPPYLASQLASKLSP